MTLLIVIPTCTDDSPIAERLLDWIYQVNFKQAHGHVLLAFANDVHAEMRAKLRICAELAFEGVSEFQAKPCGKGLKATKVENCNDMLQQTAQYVAHGFRWPWFCLEPDAVPLVPDWIEQLSKAYSDQPKKFMGPHMRRKVQNGEELFLGRTSVYPTSAFSEFKDYKSPMPIEWEAGRNIIPRSTKTRLIQQGVFDESTVIRPDAVVFHSDKTGALISQLRERGVPSPEQTNGQRVDIRNVTEDRATETISIPALPTVSNPVLSVNFATALAKKIDGRTKEGRALKAQRKANA